LLGWKSLLWQGRTTIRPTSRTLSSLAVSSLDALTLVCSSLMFTTCLRGVEGSSCKLRSPTKDRCLVQLSFRGHNKLSLSERRSSNPKVYEIKNKSLAFLLLLGAASMLFLRSTDAFNPPDVVIYCCVSPSFRPIARAVS